MRIDSEEFQSQLFRVTMWFLAITVVIVGLLEHI